MLINFSSLHTLSDVMGTRASMQSVPTPATNFWRLGREEGNHFDLCAGICSTKIRAKKTYARGCTDYGVKDDRIVHLAITCVSGPSCLRVWGSYIHTYIA
uniref:(northern house mosquito) hypothetical protein n=1 Tax=Culex pipiens TaxID=7175 RepID=A0A8D8FW41_CULPI